MAVARAAAGTGPGANFQSTTSTTTVGNTNPNTHGSLQNYQHLHVDDCPPVCHWDWENPSQNVSNIPSSLSFQMGMVMGVEWNGHGMNPSRYVFPFRGQHTDGQEGPSDLRSHLDDGWWVQKVVFFDPHFASRQSSQGRGCRRPRGWRLLPAQVRTPPNATFSMFLRTHCH